MCGNGLIRREREPLSLWLRRQFCGNVCRGKGNIRKVAVACSFCKTDILIHPYRIKRTTKHLFCNRECQVNHKVAMFAASKIETKRCLVCDSEMVRGERSITHWKMRIYCSIRCAADAKVIVSPDRFCKTCERVIPRKSSRPGKYAKRDFCRGCRAKKTGEQQRKNGKCTKCEGEITPETRKLFNSKLFCSKTCKYGVLPSKRCKRCNSTMNPLDFKNRYTFLRAARCVTCARFGNSKSVDLHGVTLTTVELAELVGCERDAMLHRIHAYGLMVAIKLGKGGKGARTARLIRNLVNTTVTRKALAPNPTPPR